LPRGLRSAPSLTGGEIDGCWVHALLNSTAEGSTGSWPWQPGVQSPPRGCRSCRDTPPQQLLRGDGEIGGEGAGEQRTVDLNAVARDGDRGVRHGFDATRSR